MGTDLRWRHIILNTHSSWLHGSPRGFRSRHHRIHSSGDYKTPPPEREHAGLYRYHFDRSAPMTVLPHDLFGAIGRAVVSNNQRQRRNVLAVSANPTHAHVIVELPDDLAMIREAVGWMKWFAARAIRQRTDALNNVEIWAEGEGNDPIDDASHLSNATSYVLTKQGADAWTWSRERGASW